MADTGRDLARARIAAGLTQWQMGVALGYDGNQGTIRRMMRRAEREGAAEPLSLSMQMRFNAWKERTKP